MVGTNITDTKLFALHSCDNRKCCNPRHLRWGDAKENACDAVERCEGRLDFLRMAVSKAREKQKRLNPSQVRYIRNLSSAGYSYKQIAQWYCVSKPVIAAVVTRRSYADIE